MVGLARYPGPLNINVELPPTRATEVHPLPNGLSGLSTRSFQPFPLLSQAQTAGSRFLFQSKGIQFISVWFFSGSLETPVYPRPKQRYQCIIQAPNSGIHGTAITAHKFVTFLGNSHHAYCSLLFPGQNLGFWLGKLLHFA